MINNLLENLIEQGEKDLFKPYSLEEYMKIVLRNCTKNSDGTYSCEGNVNLTGLGLKKIPVRFKRVEGSFFCENNKLTTLEGPKYVGGSYFCEHNELTTLKGSPKRVKGEFDCSYNNLTTLEGAPKYVGNLFDCRYNKLTTLKGAPKYVGEGLLCSHNPVPEDELVKTVKRHYLE